MHRVGLPGMTRGQSVWHISLFHGGRHMSLHSRSLLRLSLTALAVAVLLISAPASFAANAYFNGALTTSSPTFVNPGGSTAGTARHYYNVQQFTVDTAGTYTFES